MRSFTSGGKITKKKLFPQIILSIYSWDLGRQVGGPVSHGDRHLGMGACFHGIFFAPLTIFKGGATDFNKILCIFVPEITIRAQISI